MIESIYKKMIGVIVMHITAINDYVGRITNVEPKSKLKASQKANDKELEDSLEETEKTSDTAKEIENTIDDSYKKLGTISKQLRSLIEKRTNKLEERIKKGEDAPKIQIGASAMTEEEWKKLMKKVDDVLAAIKEQREEEEEKQDKEKVKDEALEKHRLEKCREELLYLDKEELAKWLEKIRKFYCGGEENA